MNDAEKFLRGQALIAKMNSINATVEGMKAFNQSRVMRDESPGYCETDFFDLADRLDGIAKQLENLI